MRANRRAVLAGAGAGAAAALVTAPAVQAQTGPTVRWRLATSFPKSLGVLHGNAERIAKHVGDLTDGRLTISVHAGGEIVPPFGVFDGVSSGSIQCAFTAPYYFTGKDPSFAFDTVIPFGMNARNHLAWMRHGGGLELLRELYKPYNIINFPAGNTGAQMGGWFRKTIESAADLKGLRMRIPGWGGRILAELGVLPQVLPGGEVYQALEKGTIDATEFVGPYDDEKLGLVKVAPHYYYPGFWEPSAQVALLVNAAEFEKLPAQYKAAVEIAASEAYADMVAHYDAQNPVALRKLVSVGAKLHRFPDSVLEAAQKVTDGLLDTEAKGNPHFAKLLASYREFRDLQMPWYSISEYSMEAALRRRR